MKLALYGLPCAGKTTQMALLPQCTVVHGSSMLNQLAGGRFSALCPKEQAVVRVAYTDYLRSLTAEIVLSDGHYSFLDEVVFTPADGDLYDAILYLYCPPETLAQRIATSEKNKKYRACSPATLAQWQDFEMERLRAACHTRGKDFYVVSDGQTSHCQLGAFITALQNGLSPHSHAGELAAQMMALYPTPSEVVLVDGDKTLLQQDSFRFCCGGKTKVFDGDFYTAYQSFLFGAQLAETALSPQSEMLAALCCNEAITQRLQGKQWMVLSAGVGALWAQIGWQLGIAHLFAGHTICADTKYYVTKLLQQSGYRVVAYGDSKMDLYMLRAADEGYLYLGGGFSRSLRTADLGGVHLLYPRTPYLLAQQNERAVCADIALCKSDSGVQGAPLAAAHLRLGQQLGAVMAGQIPAQDTAIWVLERGGRFFGDGLYAAFGGVFYPVHPRGALPACPHARVVLVDSVINTGKSLVGMIAHIKAQHPDVEVFIATNVIQQDALERLAAYKIYAIRASQNSFVGKHQGRQTGASGPDTAQRLFHYITTSL